MPTKDERASAPAVDEIDAGWDDDDEGDEDQDDDLDAGWDADESAQTAEAREREWRGFTPEERAERVARAAAKRERLRAKAAAKAERRKERASLAKSKQKQKQKQRKTSRPPRPRESRHVSARAKPAEPIVEPDRRDPQPRVHAAAPRRNDPKVVALLVAIVLLAGGVAFFLWKR